MNLESEAYGVKVPIEVSGATTVEQNSSEHRVSQVRKLGELAYGALALLERPLTHANERIQAALSRISMGGIEVAGIPRIMTMARGGNYKNQRINLQNAGKANAKLPMSPEQKRARKRKRKKK